MISGRAQALLGRLRDEHDRAAAGAIVEAATRLSDLVSRLHRIANPPALDLRPTDLATMMGEVIKLARVRCASRTTPSGLLGVKLTLAEGLDTARLDSGLMVDALVEIVVNAIESGARSPVEVRLLEDADDTSCLLVQVVDDGAGMSEHALEHAVDPFFSEKPAGRQPGLGLALAHRLVGLHGGQIVLASRPGRGTSVTVALPDYRWSRDGTAGRSGATALTTLTSGAPAPIQLAA